MVMGGIVVVTIAMLATHLSSLNKANLTIVVVMRNKRMNQHHPHTQPQ